VTRSSSLVRVCPVTDLRRWCESVAVNTARASLVAALVGALSALVIAGCSVPTSIPAPAPAADVAPALAPPPSTSPATAAPTMSPATSKTTSARRTSTKRSVPVKPRYSCEPSAPAKVDPKTNIITNKSCPAIAAAKEKAQREDAERQQVTGETRAQYCQRTGQSIVTCDAG
jgi:hypothetical protein